MMPSISACPPNASRLFFLFLWQILHRGERFSVRPRVLVGGLAHEGSYTSVAYASCCLGTKNKSWVLKLKGQGEKRVSFGTAAFTALMRVELASCLGVLKCQFQFLYVFLQFLHAASMWLVFSSRIIVKFFLFTSLNFSRTLPQVQLLQIQLCIVSASSLLGFLVNEICWFSFF